MFVSKVAQNDDYALVPSIETYVFFNVTATVAFTAAVPKASRYNLTDFSVPFNYRKTIANYRNQKHN